MEQDANVVGGLPWVAALKPQAAPRLAPLLPGRELLVWHIPVLFELWTPTPAYADRWKADKKTFVNETWQKNPLVQGRDSGCEYSCGEVELAARMRNAGFNAIWMSEWSGFPQCEPWQPFCVKRNEFQQRAPHAWKAGQQVREAAANRGIELGRQGGHPDIAAWGSDGKIYYAEYKGPSDSIKTKQYDWAQTLHEMFPDEVRYVVANGIAR